MVQHINKKIHKMCPFGDCLDIFRVMSDKTRQDIVMFFEKKKEARANDIADAFALSRPTISHHLNMMKRIGVLNSRKEGKEIYYSFNKNHVIRHMKSIVKTLERCC